MDKKEKLHNTWAMADKPLIDTMTKRTQRLSSTLNNEYSSDETSNSDSDSNNDFLALPEEFRPNLNINKPPQKQTKDPSISPNQTLKNQPDQREVSSFDETTNTPSNRSLPENFNQTSPLQENKENSFRDNDLSILKAGADSKIRYQIVKIDNFQQNEKNFDETSENAEGVKGKTLWEQKLNKRVRNNELLLQQNSVSISNEHKSKKSLKYECEHKEQQRTIHLNFDNLSFKGTDSVLKEGLKYEMKLARNTYTNHKNDTREETRITNRNTKKRSNLLDGQLSASPERNAIKWDSSLNLRNDGDSKIEWTVIREKTSLTVRKQVGSPKFKNELVFGNSHANRATFKKYYNGKFNNSLQKEADKNQHTKPKTIRNSSLEHKKCSKFNSNFNNLLSENENNLKYTHIIRNPHSSSDTESSHSEESSYQSTSNRRNVENSPGHNSPCEASDLPAVVSNTVDHKLLLSVRNKERKDFFQLQDQAHLNLPSGFNFAQRENLDTKPSRDLEENRESILRYGREISDLIIGSYIALNMLISFYREWAMARKELIHHFEEMGKQLKESSKKHSTLKDIIQITNAGAKVAVAIPHPAASIAARVVSVITSLLQNIINKKNTNKPNVDDSDEITRAMLKDCRTSNELYMYGLQCSQQFEETIKLIEEFHSSASIQGFSDFENPEITTFIRGFLEFKPSHRTFYKKLHKCFQELLQTSTTNFSKKFCEPFSFYSSPAVDVIGHLDWKFQTEDFDGSSVRHELENLQCLIQNSSSTSLEDLQKRIQCCTSVLRDELEFIESKLKNISLFESSFDDFKLSNK